MEKKLISKAKVVFLWLVVVLITLFAIAFALSYFREKQNIKFKTVYIENHKWNSFYKDLDINKAIADLNYQEVLDFYNSYTLNNRISEAIIGNSLKYNIPINLTFALAWAESRFRSNVVSVENSNGSTDWGLFQLNSYGRLDVTMKANEMINIERNSEEGISFLKSLMNEAGNNKVVSLAAYNAGKTSVNRGSIGGLTLSHIDRILEYEKQLDIDFNIRFNR